jgi:tetratricopeptide (TPR) repeat protein
MTEPDHEISAGTVPAVWGDIPSRNKNFTGRVDILARLRDAQRSVRAVLPGDQTLPRAVQGLGGVGKTAIAIEYAYRHRGDYELIWWISADQESQVRPALAALADRLRLAPAAVTGIDAAAAAALDALRRGEPYRRWLLIFDNADQPETIHDLIPDGPGDVLITSRNHRWQAVADTVKMDVFSRPESIEFLNKRVPKGLRQEDADGLADELGDLPLALEQAGAMLTETGMPVDQYRRLLKERVGKIMSEGKSPDYPLSMTAAWRLSVDTLEETLPQAQELLRCCAFFGPEPIPTEVFRRGTQTMNTRVASLVSDPILLARATRELGRLALVTIDGQTVSVHRLIQSLLRDELSPEEQAAYRNEAQLIMAAAAPRNPSDERLWPQYRGLLPHVTSPTSDLARSKDPAVRAFALDMMRYLYLSGNLATCLSLTERFIEQWTEDSGPDSQDVLNAQRHQGNALRLLGRYQDSYDLTRAILTASTNILGERDPMTLSLRLSFGADLRARGEFAAARDHDEQSRALMTAVYSPEDPQVLRLQASIALDHGLNSAYTQARELYQLAFQLMSVPSQDVPSNDVVGAWTGLAWAVRMCGAFNEARDVSQFAWDYAMDRLGAEHLATLRSLNALTIASRRIPSAREEALTKTRNSLKMATRLFEERNPDTLATAINLANLLRTTDNLDEALELAEKTVALYPAAYGPKHPYNYGCMGNLALLRRVTGDVAGARKLDEEAMAGLDARLGRNHHYTLTVAVNLASDLADLGLASDARALSEGTLRRMRAVLGEKHPTTLGCAANLSIDRRASGDEDAAESLMAETMSRYQAILGLEHPDALAAAEWRRLDLDFDPPPI